MVDNDFGYSFLLLLPIEAAEIAVFHMPPAPTRGRQTVAPYSCARSRRGTSPCCMIFPVEQQLSMAFHCPGVVSMVGPNSTEVYCLHVIGRGSLEWYFCRHRKGGKNLATPVLLKRKPPRFAIVSVPCSHLMLFHCPALSPPLAGGAGGSMKTSI